MPFARRHVIDADFIPRLDAEMARLLHVHAGGIVVRLHIPGDFASIDYLRAWLAWMVLHPRLHVFGFTAHSRDSAIGSVIDQMNAQWPDRWAIRFSVPPDAAPGALQATTIWRQPEGHRVPEGVICPAQTGATEACATCGLCWAPAASGQRIVFIGHGMRRGNQT